DRPFGDPGQLPPPRAADRRAHRRDPVRPRLRRRRDRRVAGGKGGVMSKAFVKESDQDEPDLVEEAPAIPAGVKNYMTPEGYRRMQDELRRLARDERPKVVEIVSWAAGNGDRSENGDYIYGKKRLREIDGSIRFLTKRLERAEVVDPAQQQNSDQAY